MIYGSIINMRNHMFDRGMRRSYQVDPLVVSVGNIEVGGTGKTPFTLTLTDALQQRGHRVAVVTRGYRGKAQGPLIVTPEADVDQVGDEALLMARGTTVPIIKSPDRVAGADFAHEQTGADIIILDDGFQHRRIRRDLDIVLVSRDVEKDRLLPCGRLREPANALERADFVIGTKGASGRDGTAILAPRWLVNHQGRRFSLDMLDGHEVLAFCGIGNPRPFTRTLESLGARVHTLEFGDHHRYREKDIRRINEAARDLDLLVTTEKDMVKLDGSAFELPLHALRVAMEISSLETIVQEIEHRVLSRFS